MVGIACSTYHYRLNAMRRPDKDAPLLELVREAFENSRRRYGYRRVRLELKSIGVQPIQSSFSLDGNHVLRLISRLIVEACLPIRPAIRRMLVPLPISIWMICRSSSDRCECT